MNRLRTMTRQIEGLMSGGLANIPLLATYARARGWFFVASWCQRLCGLILIGYLWFHILTLTALSDPDRYNAKMRLFQFFLFAFLEWLLALPVIFHALNGGRIILYEQFASRRDDAILRWVMAFSLIYFLFLGLMLLLGDQTVSPAFFWLSMLIMAAGSGLWTYGRIWRPGPSVGWRLQRISGAYMMVMVPAHLLFMHLNPSLAHDAGVVTARMQHGYMKVVDLTLLGCALYHGGYGLLNVVKDYLTSWPVHLALAVTVAGLSAALAWAGLRLTP